MLADDLKAPRAQLEQILASPEDRDTLELIHAIVDLAQAMGLEAADRMLERAPELTRLRPHLPSEFHANVVDREIAEARRLLATPIAAPASYRALASPTAASMYDRLAGVAEHVARPGMQRIVMVGCGWRPVTMFHLHDTTDAREIVGLDVVPDAVETAAALARKLGYDRIRTELRDGTGFDYAGADIVYVASMVSPKPDVIARILDTAPEDVRIVLWEPVALGRLWVEGSMPERNPRLEITGRGPVMRLSQDVFARRRRPAPGAAT